MQQLKMSTMFQSPAHLRTFYDHLFFEVSFRKKMSIRLRILDFSLIKNPVSKFLKITLQF